MVGVAGLVGVAGVAGLGVVWFKWLDWSVSVELIIEILLPTTPGTMLPCGTVQHRPGHTTQYTKYYFLQRSFHPAIGFLLLPLH